MKKSFLCKIILASSLMGVFTLASWAGNNRYLIVKNTVDSETGYLLGQLKITFDANNHSMTITSDQVSDSTFSLQDLSALSFSSECVGIRDIQDTKQSNSITQKGNDLYVTTDKATVISLYATNGVLLQKQSLTAGHHTIDISLLPSGIYIIKGTNGSTSKIYKQ